MTSILDPISAVQTLHCPKRWLIGTVTALQAVVLPTTTSKQQIEAEQIGETMYRPSSVFPGAQLPAVTADRNLAAIGRANGDFGMAAFTPGGVALDPGTGNPIAIQGPEYVTPNTDSGSALNAPMTARSWAVEKQPGYREGGRSFGDYPQVDVTGATTLFADRLRGVAWIRKRLLQCPQY